MSASKKELRALWERSKKGRFADIYHQPRGRQMSFTPRSYNEILFIIQLAQLLPVSRWSLYLHLPVILCQVALSDCAVSSCYARKLFAEASSVFLQMLSPGRLGSGSHLWPQFNKYNTPQKEATLIRRTQIVLFGQFVVCNAKRFRWNYRMYACLGSKMFFGWLNQIKIKTFDIFIHSLKKLTQNEIQNN